VTEEEYYAEMKKLGYVPDGVGTKLTECFKHTDGGDMDLMATRANQLSPEDRAETLERMKRYLGIRYPSGARVH
jgi:hypothetical protein